MSIVIDQPRDGDELLAYAEVIGRSFPMGRYTNEAWAARQNIDNTLIARVDGTVAGGLVLLELGQYFGGREVPTVGIHAVGIDHSHRGRGVGSRLMTAAVAEIAERGFGLSCLYPATQPIYRAAGFEQAGLRVQYDLPTAAIGARDRGADLEPLALDRPGAIEPLYRQQARWRPGNLARTDWVWQRLLKPTGDRPLAYLVREGGQATGYLIARTEWGDGPQSGRFVIRDLCATTAAAARRLWTVVADQRSMSPTATLVADPEAATLIDLPEQSYRVRDQIRWMNRLVGLKAAIEARGYPAGLTARLELAVDDELVADNRGQFVVEVSGGAAVVSSGGGGRMQCHIRELAGIYTGHLSPHALALAGRVTGDADSLAAAAAMFAGPAPWLVDMF